MRALQRQKTIRAGKQIVIELLRFLLQPATGVDAAHTAGSGMVLLRLSSLQVGCTARTVTPQHALAAFIQACLTESMAKLTFPDLPTLDTNEFTI